MTGEKAGADTSSVWRESVDLRRMAPAEIVSPATPSFVWYRRPIHRILCDYHDGGIVRRPARAKDAREATGRSEDRRP